MLIGVVTREEGRKFLSGDLHDHSPGNVDRSNPFRRRYNTGDVICLYNGNCYMDSLTQ